MSFSDKTVLITGGTGSLGQAIAKHILKGDVHKLIVYSRNEFHQVEMRRDFDDPRIRYFVGNVRDRSRLLRAFVGVDLVIHAAALKHIDVCGFNPGEAIETNVNGSQNVIEAAIERSVSKVLAISSDKACNPSNVYGASKLCADKLFIAGNAYSSGDTIFSVVRFGNFADSSGSVIPYFKELADKGRPLPVTSPKMTRFHITLDEAAQFVLRALSQSKGGELFSPKMPSYSLLELTKVFPVCANIVGKRPGEKLHEEMISQVDADRTWEYDDCFITYPEFDWWKAEPHEGGCKVGDDFRYVSNENKMLRGGDLIGM